MAWNRLENPLESGHLFCHVRKRRRGLLSSGISRDCQKTIENIIEKAPNPFDYTVYFSVESAFGKAYSGSGLPEFDQLTCYYSKRLELFRKAFREQTCKRIWEELSDKGLDELSQLIHQRHEVLGRNEYEVNIFSGVNLRIAAKRICTLSNSAKIELRDIFAAYQGSFHSSTEEKEAMKMLVQQLRKIASSLKLVDRDNILIVVSTIEKCYSPNKQGEE